MPIIAIIVAIIGGIAVWYWRVKMLKDVGTDVADVVGRARGAYRMRQFRKKVDGSVLNTIEDPALAAAVYLFALANENPLTAQRGEPAIRESLAPIVPIDKLEELLAYAAWAARDLVDPKDAVRRFKPLWRKALNADEQADLIRMGEAIVRLAPNPDDAQRLSVEALRTALIP